MKFVVKTLLDMPDFTSLAPIAEILSSLDAKVAGVVPPLGKALVTLWKSAADSDNSAGSDLVLQQQAVFYNSKMYQNFLKVRCTAKVTRLREATDSEPGERVCQIKLLLANESISREDKEELEVMLAVLGPSDTAAKICFLLQDLKHFDVLNRWCPNCIELLRLRPLILRLNSCGNSRTFGNVAGGAFLGISVMILRVIGVLI